MAPNHPHMRTGPLNSRANPHNDTVEALILHQWLRSDSERAYSVFRATLTEQESVSI